MDQIKKNIRLGKEVSLSGDRFLLTVPTKRELADVVAEVPGFYHAELSNLPDSMTWHFGKDAKTGEPVISYHRSFEITPLGTLKEGEDVVSLNLSCFVPWQPILVPLNKAGEVDTRFGIDNPVGTITFGGGIRAGTLYGQRNGDELPTLAKPPALIDLVEMPSTDAPLELMWISTGEYLIASEPILSIPLGWLVRFGLLPTFETTSK